MLSRIPCFTKVYAEVRLATISADFLLLAAFSCGRQHSIFLTKDKRVFICGRMGDVHLDCDEEMEWVPTLSQVLSNVNAVWCACGEEMTAFLTEDGKVIVCGRPWDVNPVELMAPTAVIFVACGESTICAIGWGGEFYVWKKGKLPAKMIPCETQFCDCAAGLQQVFALWIFPHHLGRRV